MPRVNTPKKCGSCHCWVAGIPVGTCTLNRYATNDSAVFEQAPDWCPIQLIPEPKFNETYWLYDPLADTIVSQRWICSPVQLRLLSIGLVFDSEPIAMAYVTELRILRSNW